MKGEVRLRIQGLMPEKLLQRAMDMGIRFARVGTGKAHVLLVDVSEHDARKLMKLCKRFSIPVEVVSRRGGSAFRRWLSRRWTLGIGLLAAGALCWLFLGRLWRIDIRFTGDAAERGDASVFMDLLEDKGIRPGSGRAIDTNRLSEELLAETGDYSYVGARVKGVTLQIEAAPELPAPEVYDVDEARNLYADRQGIVVSVSAESGVPCVKPGDTVQRGQLLIRGTEKTGKEETRSIAALGEVVIRAWFVGCAEGHLTSAQVRYTGRSASASTLMTPWFEIPVTEGERFAHQSESIDDLPVGGLFLPVKLRRVTARETRLVMERGDRELLSSRLVALAMADAQAKLTTSGPLKYKVARSWINYTEPGDDLLRANAVCEIYTNAAVPWEALREG